MRIGMVLRGFFPHDIRIEKEARTLADAGHEVFLLCLGKPDQPPTERFEDIEVIRIHRRETYNTVQRTLKTFRYVTTLYDTIWAREMRTFIETNDIEALHVHDLPLVKTGLSVADEYDLPLVADLHENYPEAANQWRKGMSLPRRLVQKTFTPRVRLKRLEQNCVQQADHVVTVVEEARAHYLRDCGADPTAVSVVSNTVELARFDDAELDDLGYDDEFVISYVGSFGPHRGIETAIRAMPAVVEAVPNARLLLVGSAGEDAYQQKLERIAAESGVADNITFTGWVDFAKVPSYIDASDVCFVLHTENPHTSTTIPHKLFQYMAFEKPVVVTDVGPLGRIVRETDSGSVVDDGDSAAMATAVIDLATNEDRTREIGRNARQAVDERYNWANEGESLRGVYESL
ncbi:Glycosyltransferase involved in cell wall bisynthesis [Halogranum amylolyticum]|uniref:Glycosyltransferase involved in cell wall bisynthesis n=1 Tax=Halogranum amylolyticum TaxID=660520 RepID=A0A1H8WNB4_9EURY|nr:glycosyltransferase family 4 protein [Halogranum amylolyticum]SEP29151.1 Glycosyltransferase involved in cell wall bisynthesis [Halogranum amylolyticum]